jgi:hypothetical protein
MGKKSVYAVVSGRRPGLYASWEQCLLQVKGFPQNRYKGFESEREALQYLSDHGVAAAGLSQAAGAAGAAARAVPEPAAAGAGAAAGGPAPAAAAAAPLRKRRLLASTAAAGGSGRWTQAAPGTAASATGRVFRLVRAAAAVLLALLLPRFRCPWACVPLPAALRMCPPAPLPTPSALLPTTAGV